MAVFSPDYLPTASWDTLRLRARLLGKVRQFFEVRGFLEVETPILSADTVVDRHIEPFAVPRETPSSADNPTQPLWLQTSPEFGMKRLLAAGATAIYQVTRAFRRGEQGPLHNPEFTIVEWYRVGDDMAAGVRLLSELCECLLGRGPAETIPYGEAFASRTGVDPHRATAAELARRARELGVEIPATLAADDRDGWLDLLLADRVQPSLGIGRPVIVYDFPASQAALARVRPGPPPVAERFELYASGIELANGYHELTDPAVLRQRHQANNAWRQRDGKRPLPENSRLLAAMEAGLPPATGAALGFDRVVMLAANAKDLREAMAFPIDRA